MKGSWGLISHSSLHKLPDTDHFIPAVPAFQVRSQLSFLEYTRDGKLIKLIYCRMYTYTCVLHARNNTFVCSLNDWAEWVTLVVQRGSRGHGSFAAGPPKWSCTLPLALACGGGWKHFIFKSACLQYVSWQDGTARIFGGSMVIFSCTVSFAKGVMVLAPILQSRRVVLGWAPQKNPAAKWALSKNQPFKRLYGPRANSTQHGRMRNEVMCMFHHGLSWFIHVYPCNI